MVVVGEVLVAKVVTMAQQYRRVLHLVVESLEVMVVVLYSVMIVEAVDQLLVVGLEVLEPPPVVAMVAEDFPLVCCQGSILNQMTAVLFSLV